MTTTPDPEFVKAVALAKAQGAEPADPLKTPLAEARQQQHRYFEILGGTPPEVLSVQEYSLETSFGRFATRLYFPSAERPLPVLVFMRGAGWWAGNLDSHDRTMRLLANKSGMAVCGVDYHCAPEACFPTQLDELLATVQWLRETGLQTGVDGSRMVLVGGVGRCYIGCLGGRETKGRSGSRPCIVLRKFCGAKLAEPRLFSLGLG